MSENGHFNERQNPQERAMQSPSNIVPPANNTTSPVPPSSSPIDESSPCVSPPASWSSPPKRIPDGRSDRALTGTFAETCKVLSQGECGRQARGVEDDGDDSTHHRPSSLLEHINAAARTAILGASPFGHSGKEDEDVRDRSPSPDQDPLAPDASNYMRAETPSDRIIIIMRTAEEGEGEGTQGTQVAEGAI
ncbi:hypothetical protein C8J57DRAFT_1462184 [Mycena rebaudengoi]|nr:hypothetical protein C8J57DRAFT_1462184 [Mycena rebaudengoi]